MATTVRIEVEPSIVRWHPLVRALLCIPHLVWTGVLQVASVFISFAIAVSVLATTSVPPRLAAIQVLSLRERVRTYAYFFLLRPEFPPFATAATPMDPGDDPATLVSVDVPASATRWSVVQRPMILLLHLIPLIPIGIFLDLLYPLWMVVAAVRGGWPPWFSRLLLRTERWVGAVVLYVSFATNDAPSFGLSAYAQTGDP